MTGGHAYREITVSNPDFNRSPDAEFRHIMARLLIIRDDFHQDDVFFSFNGRDIDGKLTWEDESISVEDAEVSRIWFKTNSSKDAAIRVYATA